MSFCELLILSTEATNKPHRFPYVTSICNSQHRARLSTHLHKYLAMCEQSFYAFHSYASKVGSNSLRTIKKNYNLQSIFVKSVKIVLCVVSPGKTPI